MDIPDSKHLRGVCIGSIIGAAGIGAWAVSSIASSGFSVEPAIALACAAFLLYLAVSGLKALSGAEIAALKSFSNITKIALIVLLIADVAAVLLAHGERTMFLAVLGLTPILTFAAFILASNIVREGGKGAFELRVQLPKFSLDSLAEESGEADAADAGEDE